MSESLLPKNASKLELSLERVLQPTFDMEFDFGTLWSPAECPETFLEHLAWSERVEIWDRDFVDIKSNEDLDTRRREVIRAFKIIRKIRGTIQSIDMALKIVGVNVAFREWWEYPEGERKKPFSFIASISNRNNDPVGERERERIIRIIDSLKPLRASFELRILHQEELTQGTICLFRVTRIKRMTMELKRNL